MSIEIREITDQKSRKEFIKFRWKIYKGDKNWVPPIFSEDLKRIEPKHNLFFKHAKVKLYMAYKDGKPVGRISAHIDDNYNNFHNEKVAFFGFFESINDKEVAHALLSKAIEFAKENGMTEVRGPACFTSNDDDYGLLIEGFDSPPVIGMSYNPPYYIDLIESFGFIKAKDLVAYLVTIDEEYKKFIRHLERRLKPLAERSKKRGYSIRNVNFKNLKEEIKKLFEIYNEAWENNWGFVPFTYEEFKHVGDSFKDFAIRELAKIVEYNGEPVAFGLVIPDMNIILKKMGGKILSPGLFSLLYHKLHNFRKIEGSRLITLGIKAKYRKKGVDSLLYYHMMKDVIEKTNLKYCEVSWLLEDNYLIIRATKFMGGKHYKTYRMYSYGL